ncbi:unnamed protein product [Diatraea saccharalis]|uniref:RING-type domain-containing protein n=1 Tax=Diatraea saccharalis TaxID=40085 RepID=A0A9N9QT83_9NEOP|nr:unnamed protein product [Diatraea saccharalis]
MFSLISKLLGLLAVVNGNIVVYTPDTPHLIEDEFRDIPASFGPDLPLEGLRGFLVVGDPADGCGKLAPPPTADNFTDRWIVLVGRYNCSFEVKVRNAMTAGYDCAIVHNVNSSDLETMSAKNPEGIDIPSVFVNDVAGRQLAEKYVYTKGYYIMVNGDLPFNINTHLLLPFAVVVALCLVVILIFMIVKCIKDRRRARRHRLPNRSLKKIPTCKFSKGDPYETCAICLDDYQEGERLRVLPCAHAYHAKCVDPWLTQNRRVCPVCKRRVLTVGEREPRAARDSDDSDDTDPLLDDRDPAPTQGGTFEQQRENPFQRAARMMARRLRGRDEPDDDEERPRIQESVPANDENGEGRSDDTAPLLPPVAARAVSERRARRNARRTRSRSHPASAPAPAPSPSPSPSPASAPAPALLRSEGSINTEQHAQIGVAALPAQRDSSPHHLQL